SPRAALIDPKPFLKGIGPYLVASTKKRIERGGPGPKGETWAPNSEVTMRLAGVLGMGDGKRAGNRPLIDSGMLMGTIAYQVVGHTLYVGTGRFDNPRIGAALQFGTTRAGRGHKVTIPPRPFLGISEEDAREIEAALADELQRLLED
ncbi:MAG: phage virion morphogenesis protein, partial [Zoogloeaceae bacterium]|nr:phage virion morphogenesis protein [Zoogloeaceae bacterium]